MCVLVGLGNMEDYTHSNTQEKTDEDPAIASLNLLVCLNLQARGPMGGCVLFYSPPTAVFR